MLRSAMITLTFLLIGGLSLAAQTSDPEIPGLQATRESLQSALERFQAATGSPAYSTELRAEAREAAAAIRRRLTEGDFRDGDRVVLGVEREEALNDTFVVASDRKLLLPLIGQVSLQGVLRSELEPHLRQEIGQVIANPTVQARALLRLSVFGELGEPGYYLFPAETPLAEVMMAVGGPSNEADIDDVRLERGGEIVLRGQPLRTAIDAGWTLDELGVRAGDQLVVPRKPGFSFAQIGGIVAGITTVIFTAERLIR